LATYKSPPAMQIDTTKQYRANFHTERGDFAVDLFAADAPNTVNNFVFLAKEGFYDNVTFHRVIPGFMAQGGDPTGTGTSGPGYSFADEKNNRQHLEGTLSMANAGPNTNGSQFFICFAPQPHLNGRHTIFGQVAEGMEVVKSLRSRDPSSDRAPGEKILSIDIEER
jgi:cyclophilin family peptidyl-prolyl cis-trans isomerase